MTLLAMSVSIHHSIWSNLFVATLLGGEFANCHGQGPTVEMALISLRLTIRARRKSTTVIGADAS